jgi:hypothetical protein
MDLQNLIERLMLSGDMDAIRLNPRAQFGTPTRRYVGATLLPERFTTNRFTERAIRFRTVIANDGDRYSPAQIKGTLGQMVPPIEVILGDSDIARQFTGRDYDGLLELLGSGGSPGQIEFQAAQRILGWCDVEINLALVELVEKQRWDAIINALVTRRGDNGYIEPVYYHNPVGHRVNAGGVWSNNAYDPWPDIVAMGQFLRTKGFQVNRIIYSTNVESKLLANQKIMERMTGQSTIIAPGGVVQTILTGRVVTTDQLASLFRSSRLPVPEIYDELYWTQAGSARFMPDNVMVFACTTGRNEEVIARDQLLVVPNTLGYAAIGNAVGQSRPGRAFNLQAYSNKPPRIEGEGWQTSLPVILDPEAIGIIKSIS